MIPPKKSKCLLSWVIVGLNKINKIKINLKNAETSRSPWQEVGRRMREKKEPSLRNGEICSHLIGTLQTERTFFHPAASKIARLFTKSHGFRMLVVSATSELTYWNDCHEKHLTFDLSTTKDDQHILTPCLGDANISFGFRNYFPPTEWLLNLEIKSKYKQYLGLLSFFPLQL